MSLTSELKNTSSPVRAFIDGLSAPLIATHGNSKSSHIAAQKLGFTELVERDVLVPLPSGVDAPRSGTAFDIRTRMALGNFVLVSSTSAMGLDAMIRQSDSIENGEHRTRVMTDVYEEAQRLLLAAPTEDDLDLASLLLTPSEQFFRANINALSGSLGDALDAAMDAQAFIGNLDPNAVADIRNLRNANAEQITIWRGQIAAGEPFESNPAFVGSMLIGGADGDWLAGETLVDCKVYGELTVPKLRDFLRQLLGYVMLDLDDALKIRSVSVWLPRQATIRVWSLESLLGGDPESLLPALREGFVKSTRHDQVAVHVPATEQRKLQLVADNRFSPRAMLLTLAHSDDRDLRMRVARNPRTPVDVIRMLSEDHYAAVREGVAANGSTPRDLLPRLATDKSIAVRNAAVKNLSAAVATNRAETGDAVIGAELVAATPHDDLSMAPSSIDIPQDRDPQSIDFELLWNILSALSEHGGVDRRIIKLPDATRVFGWRTGRQPVVPERLRRGLPNHVLEAMFQPSRPPHLRQMAAALLPIDDPEVRGRMLRDDDPEIRWSALRRSKECADEAMGIFLEKLAGSRDARVEFSTTGASQHDVWKQPPANDEDLLAAIAAHPAMPQESLQALTLHDLPRVLLSLASNPALNEDGVNLVVERMLLVTSTETRLQFAHSTLCPGMVLEKLAKSRSIDMRVAVAWNPSTPLAVLERLAQDRQLAVRIAVLTNESSSAALVADMAEHLLKTLDDDQLLEALKDLGRRDDLQLSDELVEDALDRLSKSRLRDPDPRSFVAQHNRTAPRTLARLAKSADEELRQDVAGNTRTPEETLKMLLRDESLSVRVHAARSVEANAAPNEAAEESAAELEVAPEPTVNVADLHEMIASKSADTRKQAAYSEAATPDMLTFLAGDRRSVGVRRIVAAHPGTPPATLRSLVSESDAQIAQSVAFNAGTPVDVLAELAGRSIDLALLVAFNPDAPDGILGILVDDEDPLVQFVAQEVSVSRRMLGSGERESEPRELNTSAP